MENASLESLDKLGIRPVKKELVVDLSMESDVMGELEGMTLVDSKTLVLINDSFGRDQVGRADVSRFVLVKLSSKQIAGEKPIVWEGEHRWMRPLATLSKHISTP